MPGSSPGHHSDFLCLSSQEDLGIVSFSRSDYIYGPCLLRNTPSPPAEDVFWGRRPGCPSGPGTYSADFAISHRSVWTFYVSFSRGVLLTVTSLWGSDLFLWYHINISKWNNLPLGFVPTNTTILIATTSIHIQSIWVLCLVDNAHSWFVFLCSPGGQSNSIMCVLDEVGPMKLSNGWVCVPFRWMLKFPINIPHSHSTLLLNAPMCISK